jgi:hypothetical protein
VPKLSVCDVSPFSVTFNGMLLQSKDTLAFSYVIELGSLMDINETLCDMKVQTKHKHHISGFYIIALNPTNS